ncbi:MAG: phage head-tail connector protein [Alphaproteobacteria bacterium]|nr:phage head-tail connector protein [Alphaproteobacteria bacterium]
MIWLTPAIAASPLAIDLAAAKSWVKLEADETEHDDDLTALIRAAQSVVEHATNVLLMRREVTFRADAFPKARSIELLRGPVHEITAVKYLDSAGDEQTLDSDLYRAVTGMRGFIELLPGASWPTTATSAIAVSIEAKVGFEDAAKVAEEAPSLATGMKLLIAHWWRNREAVNIGNIVSELPLGFQELVSADKLWVSGACA